MPISLYTSKTPGQSGSRVTGVPGRVGSRVSVTDPVPSVPCGTVVIIRRLVYTCLLPAVTRDCVCATYMTLYTYTCIQTSPACHVHRRRRLLTSPRSVCTVWSTLDRCLTLCSGRQTLLALTSLLPHCALPTGPSSRYTYTPADD